MSTSSSGIQALRVAEELLRPHYSSEELVRIPESKSPEWADNVVARAAQLMSRSRILVGLAAGGVSSDQAL